MILTINGHSIDTSTYEVHRHGHPVSVEPQVFDLLVLLIRNRDRVVTRDEIIERIWNGRTVSEAALSSRIKAARQAIGDDGAAQKCIRTIRGRGYRVVAEVGEIPDPSDRAEAAPAMSASAHPGLITELDPPASMGVAGSEIQIIEGTPTASYERAREPWFDRHAMALACLAAVATLALVGCWYAFQHDRDTRLAISLAAYGMPKGPKIAVHGFNNLSGDPSLDFFGDAITEEIVTELTRFSELRVTAGAQAPDGGRRTASVRPAATEPRVAYLLRGSLRRSDARVRVTAQLLKAADGSLVWAETYQRHVTPADILAVQSDIASKVVASIASISTGVIARETLGATRGRPPRAMSAYECTIKAGEILMAGFTAKSHLAARKCLEAAVVSEPKYASAWAMLAWTHSVEYTQQFNKQCGLDPRQRALEAAGRAIELDPANPMARFAMARAAYLLGDLSVFYAEAAKALSLNPHEPFLLGSLGTWLAFTGRWDEGVPLVKKAMALSPNVYPRWWHMAIAKDHYRRRDFRAALAEFKKVNLPKWWLTHLEFAYTYAQLGDRANAQKAAARLLELYPGFDLEKAVMEHRKYSFEASYIELMLDGLRKAGIPERSSAAARN